MEKSLDEILNQEEKSAIGRATKILFITAISIFSCVGGIAYGQSHGNSNQFSLPAGFDPTMLSAGIGSIGSTNPTSVIAPSPSALTGTVSKLASGNLSIDLLDGSKKGFALNSDTKIRISTEATSGQIAVGDIVTINVGDDNSIKSLTILK